jgi:tripartite ATP-independent transporter DctM subunit
MSIGLAIVLILTITLFLLNVPIWVALVFASIPYFIINQVPLSAIPSYMSTGMMTSFVLIAFPLFTLSGRLLNASGITQRIFNFADINVGWIRGGLGHVNVAASMIFAGMSGSAVADLGALGQIEIKGMTDKGYDLEFSTGITLASSTIGPIIPPSTSVILYAVIANASVAKLFLGGIVPGVLMGITLMIMVYFMCKNRNYAVRKMGSLREWLIGLKDVSLALLSPVIMLVGILGGVFTPTEASAVLVAYAIFLGTVVYREMSWKSFVAELRETVKLVSNVYAILGGALIFGFILSRENAGSLLVSFIAAKQLSPLLVTSLIAVLVLFLGCFIEVTAMMMLILPVLMPVVRHVGIDVTYFGVLFIMAAVYGVMTPPFGLGLFIMSGMTGLSFKKTVRATVPFLIPLGVTLFLVILVPQFILFVPNLLAK